MSQVNISDIAQGLIDRLETEVVTNKVRIEGIAMLHDAITKAMQDAAKEAQVEQSSTAGEPSAPSEQTEAK